MAQYEGKLPTIAKRVETEGAVSYTDALFCGKLIGTTITPNNQNVELHGDDEIAESYTRADTANISLNTTEVPVAAAEMMFGATVTTSTATGLTTSEVTYTGEEGLFTSYAFITGEMVRGVTTYVVHHYPKVKWQRPAKTVTTRSNTVSFGTPTMTGTAYYDGISGYSDREFHFTGTGAEAAAITKLKTLAGMIQEQAPGEGV